VFNSIAFRHCVASRPGYTTALHMETNTRQIYQHKFTECFMPFHSGVGRQWRIFDPDMQTALFTLPKEKCLKEAKVFLVFSKRPGRHVSTRHTLHSLLVPSRVIYGNQLLLVKANLHRWQC
jgi:hypothetical protein